MSKIVVTGGAAQACAKAGNEVVIIDNLDEYYSPTLKKRI